MNSPNRKTRKEQNKERDVQKACHIFDEYFCGATDDEIEEIVEFIKFYCSNFMNHANPHPENELSKYVICKDTWQKYILTNPVPSNFASNDFLGVFSTEASRKGFDSILTYVRFLKLTILEEDGIYRIVSENEQRSIKQWVQLKENFRKKRGIYVEMATPESTHVLEIHETKLQI